jgi:hypothetical protein
MEATMREDEPKQDEDLPDIPDYPEAPLPAWKHYGITNYASNTIVEELESVQYKGYMIGLEVAYAGDDKKTYAMRFGKVDVRDEVDLPDEGSNEKRQGPELPLSDEFLDKLSDTIDKLIAANVPDDPGNLSPELTIVITGSTVSIRTLCTKPDICAMSHTGKRRCKSVNYGPWECLHGKKCT